MSAGCKPKRIGDFHTVTTRNSTTTNNLSSIIIEQNNDSNRRIQINEDSFHIQHLIDTGGFGFVFKAIRTTTKVSYALKVQPMEFMARLSRAGGRALNKKSLYIERNTLIECRGNPFIVSLEYAFCTPLYAVLAMEYIPGEFFA